jgi:hypothetical protein
MPTKGVDEMSVSTQKDARGWLSLRQAEIISDAWKPPGAGIPQQIR